MTHKRLHLCSSEGFSPPELLAAHDTQLQTRFGMTGRSPPCIVSIHCRLQRPEWLRNGCTGAVQKECSPPELLATHDTQLQTWSGLTGTVQTQEQWGAGGAQPPESLSQHYVQFLCKLQRRLHPIFCNRRITPYLFSF